MNLSECQPGWQGKIKAFVEPSDQAVAPDSTMISHLQSLGFVANTPIRVLYQAPLTRDPIAVQVRGATFALRRSEAFLIEVEDDPS